MKRIKILVLFILLMIASGCSVNYDLTINSDYSVNEKVTADEKTTKLNMLTGLDGKESVMYLYDMFDRKDLDSKISYSIKNAYTTAIVTADHNSIEEYGNSFTSDIFDSVEIEESDNYVTMIYKQTKKMDSNDSKALLYDSIYFNISLPFKVIKNNADSVDEEKNIYTWKILKNQELRTIEIIFDKDTVYDKNKIKIGDVSFYLDIKYIVLIGVLLIITIAIVFIYIKNKKNNRV